MPKLPLRPALVVIDMQNDFLHPGAPMEVPQARQTVAPIAKLIKEFRRLQLPVVFTRYIATSSYRHLQADLPWLKLIEAPIHACEPGYLRHYQGVEGPRDCADMIDELAPQPGEVVIDKPYFSAFHATDLDAELRRLGAQRLVLTGTIAEMCVEDTARHAVHYGWPVQIVSDAVSSKDEIGQQAFLRAFARNYGQVCDSAEALSQIA